MQVFYIDFCNEAGIDRNHVSITEIILQCLSHCLHVSLSDLSATMTPDELYAKIPFWRDCDVTSFLSELSISMEFDIDRLSMRGFPRLFNAKFFSLPTSSGATNLGHWVNLLILWLENNEVECILPKIPAPYVHANLQASLDDT